MSVFKLPCPHNDNKECEHCPGIIAQDGWRFKRCYHQPYKGKFVAEIIKCPKTQKGEYMKQEDKELLLKDLCARFILSTMSDGGVNTEWETFGVEIMSIHPRYGDKIDCPRLK